MVDFCVFIVFFYCACAIMKTYMDPLYANYDKRKKTLDENSAPVPQPTPNSMPVFGAAAAPVVNQTPVAEPASVAEPTPAPAPAVEPVAEPAPVATPVAELDPTIESTPVQDPFAPKPQSNDFQQEFEQLVDGTKPAQLSEPQPQFNPNYTGTGDIVLNLDQPKKKFNTKIIAIIAGIVVVTILAVVLIAMGGGKKGGAGNNKQDVTIDTFANYLLYGKESSEPIPNPKDESWIALKITKNEQAAAAIGENFFENLIDMSDSLLQKEKKDENLERIKTIREYLDAAKIYHQDSELEKEMYEKFEEECGYEYDSMVLAIEEELGQYTNSENQYVVEYGNNKKEYFENEGEVFAAVAKVGCNMHGKVFDDSCLAQKIEVDELEDLRARSRDTMELNKRINLDKNRINEVIMEQAYNLYIVSKGVQ